MNKDDLLLFNDFRLSAIELILLTEIDREKSKKLMKNFKELIYKYIDEDCKSDVQKKKFVNYFKDYYGKYI